MLRPEFEYLSKWIDSKEARPGRWFRIELDKYEIGKPSSQRQWWACIELRDRLRSMPPSDIETRTLPAINVASVTFDPKEFSSRLVYHGLECWLDWRTKFGEYEEAGPTREVYTGDPWTDKKAKKTVEVQVPIRKIPATRRGNRR